MTSWKNTLNLSDVWADAKGNIKGLRRLCLAIADRLERIKVIEVFGAADLVDEFRELAVDSNLDVEMFDEQMSELYVFCDQERIWVRTF